MPVVIRLHSKGRHRRLVNFVKVLNMENEILIQSYINKSMWLELHEALLFARERIIKDIDLRSDMIDVDYYKGVVSHLDILSFFMRASMPQNSK